MSEIAKVLLSYVERSGAIGIPGSVVPKLQQAADALEAQEAQIAALETALREISELNLENEDENGHRWVNSDLIDQTIRQALSKAPSIK